MSNKYFLFFISILSHTRNEILFRNNIFTLNLIFITLASKDKFVEKLDLQKSEFDL